jgi:hypothetical protein
VLNGDKKQVALDFLKTKWSETKVNDTDLFTLFNSNISDEVLLSFFQNINLSANDPVFENEILRRHFFCYKNQAATSFLKTIQQ